MREIKFRGQRTDNKEWVYGYYLKITEGIRINHIIIVENIPKSIIDCTYVRYYVIPESVGQFTGIKDKSGKEIYEGDINEYGQEIKIGSFYAYLQNGIDEGYPIMGVYSKNQDGVCVPLEDGIKIIGNKFENPELLKED